MWLTLPLGLGALIAAIIGGSLLMHEWSTSLKAEGARAAVAECQALAAKESEAAVERLKESSAGLARAAHAANEKFKSAEERAAAAHQALEAERAAHAQTRANQCNAGCTLHLPSD